MAVCEKGKRVVQYPPESLNSLYINVTRFCNLGCKHCWLAPPRREELKEEDREMSIKEIIAIVKATQELGLDSIKLTGGEPLLRNDLEDLLRFCLDSDIEVDVETNGTLVSKKVARMFAKYELNHISVSLDGFSEEKHDFFRGQKGAFKLTVKGIENLINEGCHVQVITSLYKENLKGFPYFLRLMRKLNVSDIKINTICSIGRGEALKNAGLTPTVREILDFSKKLRKMSENFPGSVYLDIPIAFKALAEIKHHGGHVCAIKNILGILSDGSVSICGIGYLDEDLLFGNVRSQPSLLKEIWLNNPVLNRIREEIPSKLEGVCGICVFRNRCFGNCIAESYYNTRRLTAPYWFCQKAYVEGFFPSTRLIPEALRT